ncbi:hypothetical protein AGABI1DRAFT_113711 [Agaricus bisporus var. burnettii JB137-S8]|uniref:glutathione transferase n=1 Tax=Agaricus bisporus var. burnettii (strain JB137-S8 / ATCC MYA-4627 / FGSC 10392) TaxID=597362 RepID=K5VXB9_AGABU|nr:uncharacterized protein AGABI1DRAFT_113711 [Agaricus bisporus var. burnettii JB137-S8]EKM79089.1 hypothetical protein AGABI1DRAFT_113711 [Agaricus bisporus var. burnettii JB137-S8]
MVLKLYGTNISPPSRYAGLVLLEMKVPFELVNVDLGKKEQKSPENLANQPFGQIPYIVEDDGFVLYESRAIARYIATKYANQGPKLIPTGDLKKIAKFEQATFAESAHFNDPAFSLLLEIFVKKMQGLTPDEARVTELKTTLLSKMDVYEQILSKQKYIAGDEITLVDLAHLPLASVMPDIGIDITTGRPHLTKWLNELLQRESWQTLKANGLVSTA